jgi:hypothetical protein
MSGWWTRNFWTVDLLHAISITIERASRRWQTDVRTVKSELWILPCGWVHQDENPRRPDGWINLPLFELGKKSEAGRSLRVVLTSCWVVRTDASWNRSFSVQGGPDGNPRRPNGWCFCLMSVQTVWHIIWTAELWIAGGPDGKTRRPDGWHETYFSDSQSVQNLLKHFWIAESLFKKNLYI